MVDLFINITKITKDLFKLNFKAENILMALFP